MWCCPLFLILKGNKLNLIYVWLKYCVIIYVFRCYDIWTLKRFPQIIQSCYCMQHGQDQNKLSNKNCRQWEYFTSITLLYVNFLQRALRKTRIYIPGSDNSYSCNYLFIQRTQFMLKFFMMRSKSWNTNIQSSHGAAMHFQVSSNEIRSHICLLSPFRYYALELIYKQQVCCGGTSLMVLIVSKRLRITLKCSELLCGWLWKEYCLNLNLNRNPIW